MLKRELNGVQRGLPWAKVGAVVTGSLYAGLLTTKLGKRINVRIASTTRQWMALDKQIKRLCVIEVDSQQMRAGIENQLAEIK